MSHPTSFASLPEELQVMVASYLRQHNAAIRLRICQAWRRIFTPFVWRHIEVNFLFEQKVDWYNIFLESARSGSLKTHGQWIRSISLACHPAFIEEFLELSPETFLRLTSLSFTNPESDSLIASFIRKAPSSAVDDNGSGLRTLEISGFERFGDFGGNSTDALLEYASKLEVVQLEMMPCMSSKSIQQFLCSAVRLKEFNIIREKRDPDNEDLFLDAHDVVSPD
ncbi:hypothetical protein EC957_006738 [Mortierella hygrophila]|uniref:F-box domain-containing protein n=1 Tax=Mortierella hygrophila TaxID=979708 RepID=A0A9P6EZI1_9FUNG|nr:hypothetical protein EC957_006738 [Mortierella hygrophila]